MDIAAFNARWLAAWGARSTAEVLAFYHPDISYFDLHVPHGLTGLAALEAHLDASFARIDAWTYHPDEVWPVPGGYCGRWFLSIGRDKGRWMRGMDLVLLQDGLIRHNEVYAFPLDARPETMG